MNRSPDGRRCAALLASAVEYAQHHWDVFPLEGKVPAIPRVHPRFPVVATCACREGLVERPNPQFVPTAAGNPHGYTKFRAYAALNHNGDLRAAARALGKAVGL